MDAFVLEIDFQAAFRYTRKNVFRRSGINVRHDESQRIVSGMNARPTTLYFNGTQRVGMAAIRHENRSYSKLK
ncbi:hypothetical protein MIS46_02460 [Wielerella bovis]|uniref:hypothetical protein n=1 Tax=Wielerella bovis TaxID=2917790 RepID=UPI002019A449|nr:hypothetical protein [Wielerella bovis]ULJ62949.1 hypothetical protein MIS46_02460 [Wielerella bovis]